MHLPNAARSNQRQTVMTWFRELVFYFSKDPFSADKVFVHFERHSRARFCLAVLQIVCDEISQLSALDAK
jgi:hypothetical protein